MATKHPIIQARLIRVWFIREKIVRDAPAQVDGGGVGGTEG